MNKQTVLITLSPTGHYFFGGETTFGNGEERNYFAHSNPLPQQTTLLGMLRYELLRLNNALSIKGKIPDKAITIVGEKGFEYTESSPNFGCISSLSPLFLWNETEKQAYFKMSKEKIAVKENSNDSIITQICLESDNKILKYHLPDATESQNYSAKHEFIEYWISTKGATKKGDDIFGKSLTKVGIRKDTTPKRWKNRNANSEAEKENRNTNSEAEKENGFYKQELCCLQPNWQFAFLLTYHTADKQDAFQLLPQESFVVLGAEQSVFKMVVSDDTSIFNVSPQEHGDVTLSPQYPCHANYHKILLLSDAYVSNDIYNKCTFALTDVQTFRTIQTNLSETTEWVKMSTSEKNDKPRIKSTKLHLLARGSVFYCTEQQLKAMETALDNNNFKTIGYNYYSIIPPKQK
jgi:CRISPR-associated protein Cmr3